MRTTHAVTNTHARTQAPSACIIYTYSCRRYFGLERTSNVLGDLAKDLHGVAAELEAAHALGCTPSVWRHASERSRREAQASHAQASWVAV